MLALAGFDTGNGRTRDLDLYILGNLQIDNVGLNTLNRPVNPAGSDHAVALLQRAQHFLRLAPLLVRGRDDQKVENQKNGGDWQKVHEQRAQRAVAADLKQSEDHHRDWFRR